MIEGDNAPDQRLTFGRFRARPAPWCAAARWPRSIVLRPKTFGVLSSYLVQHPDRLVSKDELLAAVWPNLVVTDDTLVQSIGELRRALDGGWKGLHHHCAAARISVRNAGACPCAND